MSNIDTIQQVKQAILALERQQKRFDKLTEKSRDISPSDVSPKRWRNIQATLNWEAMDLEKRKIDLARAYKGSQIETSTEQRDFYPSAFHHYRY